jgi:FkbM family methyltransferase
MTADPTIHRSTVTIPGGASFTICTDKEADDPISRDLARGVYPCPEMLALLAQIVPRGGRVLDLGTHVGMFSLGAAASGYEVVSVEASPRNAELLRASVEANGWTNMRVLHAAVSDKPGFLEFMAHGPYGHVALPGDSRPTVKVEAAPVDDLLERVGWDRPDFIKMDIEGSEVSAVRGMGRLLGRADAPPIYFESNGHTLNFFGQTPRTLRAAMAQHGYAKYLVDAGRYVLVAADAPQGKPCVDYLAVKSWPTGLTGKRQDTPLTPDEVVTHFQVSLKAGVDVERLYGLRAVQDAPRAVQEDDRIRRTVQQMATEDESEAVRAAAADVSRAIGAPSSTPAERTGSWLSSLFRRKV